MDDELQVVDDVIEIQDEEDLIDESCQLEVSDQIDFSQDDSSMADEGQADEIYLEQSNSDFPLEDDEYESGRRLNDVSPTNSEDGRKPSHAAKINENRDDFDDLEYDTDEEDSKDEEFTDDAEDYEKEFLNMPSLHSVLNDLGSLKQGRRLMAQPLKMEELSHPVVLEIFAKLSSEDIKLQFVRSKDDANEWRGFLLMHFSSCNAAKEAAEKLKTIREDLDVKAQNETAYASKIMEQWIKDEKGQKKWTDALILMKNIPEGVTIEQVEALFPGCEDVLLVKGHDRSKDKSKDAYIMFHSKEQADQVARDTPTSGVEIEDTKLRVFKYHVPHDTAVKGLMRLSQRKMIMKYMLRLTEELEKDEEDYKVPTWCRKRLEACQSALERDDKARKMVGLPLHSYDELNSMRVKSLRATTKRDSLIRMGIIDRPQRRQPYHNSGGMNSSGGFAGNRNNSRGGSISGNRSRNFQSSSSYESRMFNNNRRSESLLGNPPSLTAMGPVVPPLLALQHNAGMMRMMMAQQQQHHHQQQQQRSYENSNLRRGSCREPPTKLLRMDEKGMYHNYRPPSSVGSGASRGRGDKRPISLLDL